MNASYYTVCILHPKPHFWFTHLPGQWLQCQTNGSSVCRVLRQPETQEARPSYEREKTENRDRCLNSESQRVEGLVAKGTHIEWCGARSVARWHRACRVEGLGDGLFGGASKAHNLSL